MVFTLDFYIWNFSGPLTILSPRAEVVFRYHTEVHQHSSPLSKCQRPTLRELGSAAALFLILLVCLFLRISLKHSLRSRNMRIQVGEIRTASDNTNLLPLNTCSDRPWGAPSLLYNGYRVFTRGKERPGRDTHPSPLSSAVVMKRYIYTYLYLYIYLATTLLTLWAVRPVQSLSACTRVTFTFNL